MSNKIDFYDAIKIANVDNIILKKRNNGMLLSDYQISVLKRNEIDYEKYSNLQTLLFDAISSISSSDKSFG